MEHIQTLLLKEAHVSCQAPHHIPVVKKQRMKWTVLPFCLIHIMASFNLLKAITVFIGKKKKKKSKQFGLSGSSLSGTGNYQKPMLERKKYKWASQWRREQRAQWLALKVSTERSCTLKGKASTFKEALQTRANRKLPLNHYCHWPPNSQRGHLLFAKMPPLLGLSV